jgi:hypothetical protein
MTGSEHTPSDDDVLRVLRAWIDGRLGKAAVPAHPASIVCYDPACPCEYDDPKE